MCFLLAIIDGVCTYVYGMVSEWRMEGIDILRLDEMIKGTEMCQMH